MTHTKNLRRLLFLSTFLVISSAIAAGVYTRTSTSQKKTKGYGRTYQAASVTTAPPVVSNIDGLEISSVSLINGGTSEAALAIDVTNKRNEDVMALDFIAGKSGDYSGMAMDGLLEEDAPRVIIPRHTLMTFNWHLAAIFEGETVVLAAAIFADGKEEGDKHFLNGIKQSRRKYQEDRRKEKKNGGQK